MNQVNNQPITKVYPAVFDDWRKADTFVRQENEPANDATKDFIVELLQEIGAANINSKRIRAVSDLLVAAKVSTSGCIGWQSGNDHLSGGPYTARILKDVRDCLIRSGNVKLMQTGSRGQEITSIFALGSLTIPKWLKFSKHGERRPVIVRASKPPTWHDNHKKRSISRQRFVPEITVLEDQVRKINKVLSAHPLTPTEGQSFGSCYRVFNNSSLSSGGRLYGGWQGNPEAVRLGMTISGESVCEIDLKASYLNICHGIFGGDDHLGEEPYCEIDFVKNAPDELRQKELRKLAKLLVAAYVATGGTSSRFPKGRAKKGEKYVSIPMKFSLDKSIKYNDLMGQIFSKFPLLREIKSSGKCIMFVESKIFVGAISSLADQGIPAFPVHDSVLVRQQDKLATIAALQVSLKNHIGIVPDMDISYLNETGEVITSIVERPVSSYNHKTD